ncbi:MULTISPECIES: response regulator transcription factor [Pseudomonas]|uniref:Chemotaxis protein CheY n=1 Tax=Pseudomonas cichorii TaxID=36746 RepID=A0A3M4W9D7_PSECI|nr:MULTISPECIES: response regulator transcription factor [Pseudomonas]AHF67056.1 two-component system regulatory protein [Pseudomonas cichorii JBC1]QVE18935.1 response regulator transcription factor [Pseudomonas cichorii]RMR60646.1 Two-component system regulatory protein [Pseudomonas cichorii]SDN61701.1 DNA-binding response regulator, OmpR family, contains REC and winged-helix (wHTH) domain [Pseudomonas cichorii]GFM90656.1 chemotaxis protein CheY [Pseudomonas cichorii]
MNPGLAHPISLQVLIIEDNRLLAANMFDYLEACGHIPDAAPDGQSGLSLAIQNRYDAIILDWMLPRMDGMSVLRKLREEHRCITPIIMLTAKDQLEGKLLSFEQGADDYLVKPVALPELEIRLRVMVSRAKASAAAGRILRIRDLTYNLDSQEVTRGLRTITLSGTLRNVLELLMRESPRTVRRDRLEGLIWGESVPDGDLLRSHMHLLRRAIDQHGEDKLLHTITGTGYRLGESGE